MWLWVRVRVRRRLRHPLSAHTKTPMAQLGPFIPETRGLLLQWHVTERCNYRCAHCYQEEYASEELSWAEQLAAVAQFKTLLARRRQEAAGAPFKGQITVTGGEPFIREDFLDLLEVLARERHDFTFAILTNGSLIDGAMARRLKALRPRFVQVSIDGTEATNDRLRCPGAYRKAVAALRALKAEGVPAIISFTAQRENWREFPAVARLACELGVNRVWSDRLIPCGSGAAFRDLLFTPEETRAYFELMASARAEAARSFGRTDVALARALQFLVGGGKPYHCAAGDSLVTLQANGDVYPCRRMPIKAGNVRENTLEDIYYSSDLFFRLRDRTTPARGCENCRHAAACGGGLRCLSYAVYGDPLTADPGCWHARRPEDGQIECGADSAVSATKGIKP